MRLTNPELGTILAAALIASQTMILSPGVASAQSTGAVTGTIEPGLG